MVLGINLRLRSLGRQCSDGKIATAANASFGSSESVNKSSNQARNRRGRKVHFDLLRNEEHTDGKFCKEDLQELDLWYTKQELKTFELTTLVTAKRMRSSQYANILRQVYETCETGRYVKRDNVCFGARDGSVALQCVGLEHLVLPQLCRDRKSRREDVTSSVIGLQAKVLYSGKEGDVSADLRRCSEGLSARSCQVANSVAKIRLRMF